MLPELSQIGIGLKLLNEILYRKALWYYFYFRGSESSEEAFKLAIEASRAGFLDKDEKIREKNREYFESLWTEYGGPHISDSGGLKPDFKEKIIKQLRTLLLSGIEKYKFEPYDIYIMKSPGEIQVYDSQGRVTGIVNGKVKEEIPNSACDDKGETVLVFSAVDNYHCQIVGTDKGTYGLDIISVKNGKAASFTATNISISQYENHQYSVDWAALSQGSAGVTFKIDKNSDGLFEQGTITDNTFTGEEYESLLPPQVGTLSISSVPSGAEIYIDNVKMAQTTPAVLTYIPAGTHTIKLILPGYNEWIGKVVILSGEVTELQITLTELTVFNIVVYPNPFKPKLGHTAIRFEQLPENVTIRIYNIAGELIRREENITTGLFSWDVTNQHNEKVATGVYIYIITDNKGGIKKGKIAIIR
jgi:hypothetical protein